MYVINNAGLTQASLPGLVHQTLAGSGAGLKGLSVWRQTISPGAATPPHRHDCEEVVVVSAGRGELHIADGVHTFGPDSTLVLPRNVNHQIFNTGTEPIELVAVLSMTPVEVVLPDGQPLPLPWSS